MKKICCVIVFSFLFSSTFAQPIRNWGTYLGGNYVTEGSSIAVDKSGNVYLAGRTDSSFITTPGCHQSVYGGDNDNFLAKFNSAGMLQWSTYYGGPGWEGHCSVATDTSGNVFLAGQTSSSSGMTSSSSHQSGFGGLDDFYIAKFNSAGVRQWATYAGGVGAEGWGDMCCDKSGNVYICGTTYSSTNIATPGTHMPVYGGLYDACVVKFNSAGVCQWGTYYGDTASQAGNAVAVDDMGNVYISGVATLTTGGIATPGSHQPLHGGGATDVFVAKLNSTGNRLWGTYYGGTQQDEIPSLASDSAGNLYLMGRTESSGSISTPGTFQPVAVFTSSPYSVFLVNFNTAGVRQWGTYFGNGSFCFPFDIKADNNGNCFFAGSTDSGISSAIATTGAHQTINAGGYSDGFLEKFNGTGNRVWGSFYGGSGGDEIRSIAVNKNTGNVYVGGFTLSTSGIATSGTFQPVFGGLHDAFAVKFGPPENIGIEETNIETTILNIQSIYPSFATDEINVLLYSEEQTKSIVSIFDVLGQLVWTNNFSLQQGQSELKIPVAQLSSGNYILSISVPLGNSSQRKFVK